MSLQKNTGIPLPQFKDKLRSCSLKATPQRLAVHRAMLDLGHASADEVCRWIGNDCEAKVTVASVYNILAQMTLIGVYNHRMSTDNKMYFDVNPKKHIHLYDRINNEYRDMDDDSLLDDIEKQLKRKKFKGYHIEEIDISLICTPTTNKRRTK